MDRRALLKSIGFAGVTLTAGGVQEVAAGTKKHGPYGGHSRHIVAIGGSLSATTAAAPAYLRYIMSLTGKAVPRILFVPTASGDNPSSIFQFVQDLQGFPHELTVLRMWWSLVPHKWAPLAEHYDVVYLDDGNAKSALAVWRQLGFDQALKEAWESGVVLAGVGSGGSSFFKQQLSDAWADAFTAQPSLGLVNGSCCNRYDAAARKASFKDLVKANDLADGYGIDDGAALHFVGADLERVLSVKPGSMAHYVSANAGVVIDEPLLPANRWDNY